MPWRVRWWAKPAPKSSCGRRASSPPYTFVRPDGRSGDCFASTYRQGGQFLLLLKRGDEGDTPYWAALAPVNEQLRSERDPWLAWVRREAAKRAAPRRGKD